jgi:hypothetical protein
MFPVFGVICREPFAIDEPGLKLKSSLWLVLKLGYVNCMQLQVLLLPRMTTAAEAIQEKVNMLVLSTVMAKWIVASCNLSKEI